MLSITIKTFLLRRVAHGLEVADPKIVFLMFWEQHAYPFLRRR